MFLCHGPCSFDLNCQRGSEVLVFLTMDHQDTGRQQVRLPKVVRLLKQRDVLVWSEALLQVGQVLGLSEEVIWSISSTSPSLEAAWNARFS